MHILREQKQIPNHVISASRKRFCGSMSPHGHDFFELEYVISGTGICAINGKDHPLQRGAVVLLSPADTHAIREGDLELINVMFRAEHTGNAPFLSHAFLDTSPIIFTNEQDGALLLSLLSELVTAHESDLQYAMLLLQCVLRKLNKLGHGRETSFSDYIQRAVLYVLEHFHGGVTMEETAAHLGLSKAYFSDLFLRQTGQSFKAYLDSIRFSYAKNLLAFSDLPVSEILTQAGFADYANFARRFKAVCGMTPTAYRAQNNAKSIDKY